MEYDKLLECSDTLITQLAAAKCAEILATKLRAKKLITESVFANATSAGPGVIERTRIQAIIGHVLAQAKNNSAYCSKFLDVLRDIEGLQDVVELLEGTKL